MGHESQIHHLLRGVRAQHRPTALSRRHHIGVVIENRQRVLGDGARRDVEHGRHQLARDEVEIGNHEQQTLRGRERAREATGGEGTVYGSGRAYTNESTIS